jgi:hypothetical protein
LQSAAIQSKQQEYPVRLSFQFISSCDQQQQRQQQQQQSLFSGSCDQGVIILSDNSNAYIEMTKSNITNTRDS